MGKIYVHNIRIHANHGCLKEEAIIGSDYRVDVVVDADLSIPAGSDRLSETVDYVHLNRIVKEEMAIKSNLLEHVAKRIVNRILSEIGLVDMAEVTVAKLNPPIMGDVESVAVVISANR